MTAAAVSGPATEASPPKKGSKLKLIIALAVVLALGGGAGGWYYLQQQKKKADPEHEAAAETHKTPPTFLPLESMVVNLADPPGDRMVQLGITIQLADAKSADQIKAYMPSIRSNILLLVSQRTSQDLLQREGKEKLAAAIAQEVARPLGIEPGDETTPDAHKEPSAPAGAKKKRTTPKPVNPVQDVLFSSIIIQ